MGKTKSTSTDEEQLADAKARVIEAQTKIEPALSAEVEFPLNEDHLEELTRDLREVLEYTRNVGNPVELGKALARLCSVIADSRPEEALDLAEEFDDIPTAPDDSVKALIANARNIAYRCLGDLVRARQQEAIANGLRERLSERPQNQSEGFDREFFTNLLARRKTPAPDNKYTVELSGTLGEWLEAKRHISLGELAPAFGQFTSNDRQFFRDATGLLDMLSMRLEKGLGKPDCYLLHGDPGSGKSFFVRQFKEQLSSKLGEEIIYLERNLSAYSARDIASTDIVADVLIALTAHRPILLFIDEVDTQLDGRISFQRLIAPMNGDPFFFLQKQISFAKQNLVVFFAMSRKPEDMKDAAKWPDFLSRIPPTHHIKLPEFGNPLCRIYRAVAMLQRGKFAVHQIEAAALMYIGLRPWSSVRELEQAVEMAKIQATTSSSNALELAHVALSAQDIDDVKSATDIDIFLGPTNVLEII